MVVINDELFGELEYQNNFWRGKTTITMFGLEREILLSVDAHENADFSNVQREAFINFNQEMKNILHQAEKQVFDYYSENCDEYREMYGNEADKFAPKIDSISDLKGIVKPVELIIRRVRKNGKRRIGLLCDASWDIDNGLGVKIEDELIEEVGYQDSVL